MTKKLNLKKLQQDFQNDYEQDQAKKRAIAKQSVKELENFIARLIAVELIGEVGINGSNPSGIGSY